MLTQAARDGCVYLSIPKCLRLCLWDAFGNNPLSLGVSICGPMALVPAPAQSSATVTLSQRGPLSPSSGWRDVARLVTFAE